MTRAYTVSKAGLPDGSASDRVAEGAEQERDGSGTNKTAPETPA